MTLKKSFLWGAGGLGLIKLGFPASLRSDERDEKSFSLIRQSYGGFQTPTYAAFFLLLILKWIFRVFFSSIAIWYSPWRKHDSSHLEKFCGYIIDSFKTYMDWSLPSSSVHGILQAKILEWLAIPFSRWSYPLRDWPWFLMLQADSLPSEPPGKPFGGDITLSGSDHTHETLKVMSFIS